MRSPLKLLLAATALVPSPAAAQSVAELQRQIAGLQAELSRLSAQVQALEAQSQEEAEVSTSRAPAVVSVPPKEAGSETEVAWKGAPELTLDGGWSFKPRGRLQIDSGYASSPEGLVSPGLGFGTEVRRAFLGVEGDLPGGFGYRFEADLANSDVELTDLFLTYDATENLTLTVGQHKPFQGLAELTSDLFTGMLERPAFTSAFGFERRVGVSAAYARPGLLVQLGAFSDNAADLVLDSNNSHSVDGRVVVSPKIGDATLHLGASAHFRDLNDGATSVRYRARPFVHTTDVRLVDTRALAAEGERSFGGEIAYIDGPLNVTVEGHRITALRAGQPDPSFWGGYAEVGLLVTPGDRVAYRNGVYDRIRPVAPLSQGGIGAIQLNARYDHLDLNDGAVIGGLQDGASVSAVWIPSDYVRFVLNYGHLWITDAAVPAGSDRDYQVDAVALRAQVDF